MTEIIDQMFGPEVWIPDIYISEVFQTSQQPTNMDRHGGQPTNPLIQIPSDQHVNHPENPTNADLNSL